MSEKRPGTSTSKPTQVGGAIEIEGRPAPPPSSSSAANVTVVSARIQPPIGGPIEVEGLTGLTSMDDPQAQRIDQIEMIGEEEAAGMLKPGPSEVTAGMRYLHCSRTIHQLVTDRNRAVGLYLAVATLLWTASSTLMAANPEHYYPDQFIIPLPTMQRWCLPATLATLAVLAVFAGLMLIRTRIGLIYEVAKMNALLGLPVGRVKRVNPLSLFFIMHTLISLAGGGSAGMLAVFLLHRAGQDAHETALDASLIGLGVTLALLLLYIGTVIHTTADHKLRNLSG